MLDSSEIKISIALVTRNRPESLERCLKSLRSQNFQPFEVVISDDSNDDLSPIVQSIAETWDCRYISGLRRGLYANRNHAALACEGTHIRTMDDDHEFPDGHFISCAEAVKADPTSIWVIGEYLPTDKIGNEPHPCPGQLHPRGFSYKPSNTQDCWAIADGASIYPRSLFERGIRYFDCFKFGYAYAEFGSRLHWLGYRIRHLSSTYVIHHLDLENRSYSDPKIDSASRFFAMLCYSHIYQVKLKNRGLTYFQFIKELVFYPIKTSQYLSIAYIAYQDLLRSHKELSKENKRNNPPLNLYPLWLREKIFYRFLCNETSIFSNLFQKVQLELSPKVYLELHPSDIAHQAISICGFYELSVSRRIDSLSKRGGMMVDVGANYGYYSCLWAAAASSNRVIAFEASPKNSEALKKNIRVNNLNSQIEAFELAIGKTHGYLPFNLGVDDQTGWGGLSLFSHRASIEVEVISLDDFFSNFEFEHIDVLKIDTEGADTWVLQGAKYLLKNHKIFHIFFEENLPRMASLNIQSSESKQLLSYYGYRMRNLGEGQWYAYLS